MPRKPIVSYTMLFIIIALHTKFETSSFYSSWEIFDEKFNICLYGGKEERKNKWTKKAIEPLVSFTIAVIFIALHIKFEAYSYLGLLVSDKNF